MHKLYTIRVLRILFLIGLGGFLLAIATNGEPAIESTARASTSSNAGTFKWTMAPRFGPRRPDGIIDYHWDGVNRLYDKDYVNPTTWKVDFDACSVDESPGNTFLWEIDGVVVQNSNSSCTLTYQFVTQGTHAVKLTRTASNGTQTLFESPVTIKDLLIVSIGDSFASGQGNPDVERQGSNPAKWVYQVCARSSVAGPAQAIYVPAVFDENGTRIKGVKSVRPAHYALDSLLKFYGDKYIRKIDADALRDYKVARLTGTNKLSKVKLATVDRELSKLRKLFNVAVGKGWLVSSPFTKELSRELIQDGDETPSAISIRELSDDEAQRVMTALDTPERRHTIPLFIAALDTGARKSSLVDYLKWKDINFDEEVIILTAYKGKNRNKQCWPVPMTNRLKMELLKLQLRLKHNNPDAVVFEEAKVNLRKVWRAAYAEAGVPNGVRMFYSVRHAYATDMANKGMELPELARLLGHTDVSMSYKYYNLTKRTLDKARNILNRRAVING